MAPAAEKPEPVLSVRTLTPIGQVGALVGTVFCAAWWLQGTLLDLTHAVRETRSAVDALALRVDGTWSIADMRAWVKLLEARNKDLAVPPVDHR